MARRRRSSSGHPREGQREFEILQSGQCFEEPEVLEHESDTGPAELRQAVAGQERKVVTRHHNPAALRLLQAPDQRQQGGLAGSRRPNQVRRTRPPAPRTSHFVVLPLDRCDAHRCGEAVRLLPQQEAQDSSAVRVGCARDDGRPCFPGWCIVDLSCGRLRVERWCSARKREPHCVAGERCCRRSRRHCVAAGAGARADAAEVREM